MAASNYGAIGASHGVVANRGPSSLALGAAAALLFCAAAFTGMQQPDTLGHSSKAAHTTLDHTQKQTLSPAGVVSGQNPCECIQGNIGSWFTQGGCHMSERTGKNICYVSAECTASEASSKYEALRVRDCDSGPGILEVQKIFESCACLGEAEMEAGVIARDELGCHTSPHSGKNICYVGSSCPTGMASKRYNPVKYQECSAGDLQATETAKRPTESCSCLSDAAGTTIPSAELGCHTSPHSGKDICYVGTECASAEVSKRYTPTKFTSCSLETPTSAEVPAAVAPATAQPLSTQAGVDSAAENTAAAESCPCLASPGMSSIPSAELGCHRSPHSGRDICYVGSDCASGTESLRYRPVRYQDCTTAAVVATNSTSAMILMPVNKTVAEEIHLLNDKLEEVMEQVLELKQLHVADFAGRGEDPPAAEPSLPSKEFFPPSDPTAAVEEEAAAEPAAEPEAAEAAATVPAAAATAAVPAPEVVEESATGNGTGNSSLVVSTKGGEASEAADGLMEVKRYHQQGLLSDEEYEKARADIDKMLLVPDAHETASEKAVAPLRSAEIGDAQKAAVKAPEQPRWADDTHGFPTPLTPEDEKKIDELKQSLSSESLDASSDEKMD